MAHPLVCLIQIRQKLDFISDDDLIKFVEYLIHENQRSIIVSGIFRQLYEQSASNELLHNLHSKLHEFYSSRSRKVSANSQDANILFTNIPDNLLCNIGSFLSIQDIFTSWNHVNRRFLCVGLKPETFTSWDSDGDIEENISNHTPKFKLDCILSKIEYFNYNCDFSDIITDLSKFKALKSLKIGISFCLFFMFFFKKLNVFVYFDDPPTYQELNNVIICNNLESIMINYANLNHIMESFYNHTGKLKQIKFYGCDFHYTIKNGVRQLLQIVAPLSPKEIELQQRIETEITDKLTKKTTEYEIENLQKKIEMEVNDKYEKKFNENDLSYDKNEVGRESSVLEMLSFELCCATHSPEIIQLVRDEFTLNRIQSTLINLKAIAIDQTRLIDGQDMFCTICVILLNSICNQLESLHIGDECSKLRKWKFIENNYCCTKEARQASWFPANVKELCLTDHKYHDHPRKENMWQKICKDIFPKLEHLRCVIVVDQNNAPFLSNLRSNSLGDNFCGLVDNGLKSASLTFDKLEMNDFINISQDKNKQKKHIFDERMYPEREHVCISTLIDTFRDLFEDVSQSRIAKNGNLSDQFILKLEMIVDVPQIDTWYDQVCEYENIFKQYFSKLMNKALSLFIWLKYCFNKCMLCFKIKFQWRDHQLDKYNDDEYDEDICNVTIVMQSMKRVLEDMIDEQASMQNNDSRVVDTKVLQQRNEMIFAIVWKNFIEAVPKSCCTTSHCEPHFDYYCHACQNRPWCGF